MTQLILDINGENLTLPESRKGGYSCDNTPLCKDLTMASGRMVREVIGNVYTVKYQWGLLSDTDRDKFISACEKGWKSAISCTVLVNNTYVTSDFLVTKFTFPKYLTSRTVNGTEQAIYGDFKVELREVSPHDSGTSANNASIPAARGVSF